jgi:hypothetical protein
VIFSCKEKNVALPMEKEKLVRLMEDIYIAEAMAESANLSVRDSVRSVYMKQVAYHHDMTPEAIREVMRELAGMPDTLHTIQGIVLDSLRAKQLHMREKENIGQ